MTRIPFRSLVLPAVLVALLPLLTARPAAADLDVAFVLDTTGSMSGELAEAQQRLRELAAALARTRAGERVRFGVVAFRDRGDAYVTRVSQLTAEIGTTDAFLAGLDADGGGDDPESVLAGVMTALRQMDWDRAPATERRVVLVGDAPAHLDYADEPRPEDVIAEARRAEIVIDAIGCRSLPAGGVALFRKLAYATEGTYQHIGRLAEPLGTRPGALVAALARVATPGAALAAGDELALTPLGHQAAESAVLLVRTAPTPASQGGGSGCALEVLLPPGLALTGPASARQLPDRLIVHLAVGEGSGGAERYALARCVPLALPIHVELEGGR